MNWINLNRKTLLQLKEDCKKDDEIQLLFSKVLIGEIGNRWTFPYRVMIYCNDRDYFYDEELRTYDNDKLLDEFSEFLLIDQPERSKRENTEK